MDQCPNEGNQLRLAGRKGSPSFLDHIIISTRHLHDEFMRSYLFRSLDDFFTCDFRVIEADVIGDAIRKKKHILQNCSDGSTQVIELIISDIFSVQENGALIDLIKATENIDNRGFSCSSSSDQREGLARFDPEINVF